MAIKDWKLIKKTKYMIQWNNIINHKSFIRLTPRHGLKGWFFTYRSAPYNFENKTFKTKQQALKYAKSYMRKH